MSSQADLEGMIEFADEIQAYLEDLADPLDAIKDIADDFVKDLLRLPSPRSRMIKTKGHTHLVDSFSTKKSTFNDIEVGWGELYGGFVEHGTRKMGAQPHMIPTYTKNEKKYLDDFKKKHNLSDD